MKTFQHGVACLQEGAWEEASQAFSKSLHLAKDPADKSRAAEYLTAARLLDAQVHGLPVSVLPTKFLKFVSFRSPWMVHLLQASHGDKAPTLARFGAALNLADKHKIALVQSSIQLNMEAGNYK